MAKRAQQVRSKLLVAREHGGLFTLARLPLSSKLERALTDDRTSNGKLERVDVALCSANAHHAEHLVVRAHGQE